MSNNKNMFEKLKNHTRPVDRAAARVAFFKGDHFEPTLLEGRKVWTMDNPPPRPKMPDGARDYSGLRNGRMTAMWWFMQRNPPRGKTLWVCRCDCGKYEFRKPCKWINHPSSDEDPDRCEICRLRDRAKQGISKNARSTRPERLMAWIKALQDLGLSDDEISEVRRLDCIHCHGKTADQIRQEIKEINGV